jgi:uncharacterized protein YceK
MCTVLLCAIIPVAGCGTFANVARQQPGAGGVTPFGGVRLDVECIRKATNGEPSSAASAEKKVSLYPKWAIVSLCALDLPLSLIGDILTWPYTATYSFINEPVPVPPVMIGTPATTSPAPLPSADVPTPVPSTPGSP